MRATRHRARVPSVQPPLPDHVIAELRRHFPAKRSQYIASVLSADELRVIDIRDALVLARIKRMTPQRLKQFDRFIPIGPEQQRAYQAAQMEWIKGENYLLATRLGRSPTHAELFADFTAHRNGQRFRAYYVLKHPEQMRPSGPATRSK